MNEWMKQRDLLIEEVLAFSQAVAANAPKMAVTPVRQSDLLQHSAWSAQRPVAVPESVPKDRPDTERAIIQRRLANFKANQQRFQQEREEYFQKTMAKARLNQWTPGNPR